MATTLTIGPGFPEQIRSLLDSARDVADNAYNAYSGYSVGCTVETSDGRCFSGTFMENASYGMTICAEPAAILAANSAGTRDICRMAVVGGNPSSSVAGPPCTPCGRCRQIIWELATICKREIEIYCSDLTLANVLVTTSGELLPHAWGGDNLVAR